MTEAMPFLQKYDITFLRPPTIGPGVYSHCGCPVERGREEGLSPSSGKWQRRKRR